MTKENLIVPILMSAIFSGIISGTSMSVFHMPLIWGIGVSSTLSFPLLLCFGTKESCGKMSGVLYK